MKTKYSALRASLFGFPLFLAMTVSAAVLVGNLAETPYPGVRVGPDFPDNIGIAESFLTGDNPWSVTDIQARMGDASGTVSITAELHKADPNGDFLSDGSLFVIALVVPTFGTPMANVSFTPSSQLSLDADTKYFFVLTSSSGSVAWDWADSLNCEGVGTIPATKTGFYTDAYTPWTSYDGGPVLFQVNGTEVIPEPSTWMAGGFLGVILVGRYGRKLLGRLRS